MTVKSSKSNWARASRRALAGGSRGVPAVSLLVAQSGEAVAGQAVVEAISYASDLP